MSAPPKKTFPITPYSDVLEKTKSGLELVLTPPFRKLQSYPSFKKFFCWLVHYFENKFTSKISVLSYTKLFYGIGRDQYTGYDKKKR